VNENDAARDAILRTLQGVHRRARSPRSAGIGIRDLQALLKPQGFRQQDVAANLDYLVQKGWVREVVEERTFTTAGGTRQSSAKITYKISDLGLDKLEGASTYGRPPSGGINVTTISGVTIVGDGNVVNTNYVGAATALSELRSQLLAAESVPEEDRLNAVADIDSLQGQLQKPSPTKEIVKSLWATVSAIATAAGFVDGAERVASALGPLLN